MAGREANQNEVKKQYGVQPLLKINGHPQGNG